MRVWEWHGIDMYCPDMYMFLRQQWPDEMDDFERRKHFGCKGKLLKMQMSILLKIIRKKF